MSKKDQTESAEPVSLLLVDDDSFMCHALRVSLTACGFAVAEASTGNEALATLRNSPADLVLLDINMPGISGVETCRRIRTMLPRVGILMNTVRDSEESKIEALEAGADDYIIKPFRLRELVARLRAVARRSTPEAPPSKHILRAGDVEIDLERRTLKKAGEPVHISPTEFKLLAYLMERREVPVAHSTLLQAVWGPEYGNELEYLRTFMSTLRRKIEADPAQPRYLITEPWLGYRFRDPSTQVALSAPVTFERLVNAGKEPQNWLTYSGNLMGQRFSPLDQVTPPNVKDLELKWVFQTGSLETLEATPLVVDGIMYMVRAPHDVVALDPVTGAVFWTYAPAPSDRSKSGGGPVSRGVAVMGNTLYMGAADGRLIAVAKGGRPSWNTAVAKPEAGYTITSAPLVVKDKVIVGVAGSKPGLRGFIAAYDVKSGKEAWRFYTGAPVWMTGSCDAQLNLTCWGIGAGEHPYGSSVVALDADTGELRWHYQFTPHPEIDYDAAQVPVLADLPWQGEPRKVMLWANRNGFCSVLDRATGEFLLGEPFAEGNSAGGFDEKGRPVPIAGWESPSFSPRTGLFYIPSWVNHSSVYIKAGAAAAGVAKSDHRKESKGHGAIRAIDPLTGERKWEFKLNDLTDAGILTTGSDLLFSGGREGYFYALDARHGELLWRASVGGSVTSGPMSYAVGGKQYIAVSAGSSLFVYALRD